LDHPNVSRICQWLENNTHVYIVMELISGTDLRNYIQHVDLHILFCQLMKALTYCHAHSVVHRDVKLENCLVEDSDGKVLKLIDFGLAATWKPTDPEMTCRCGTVYYLSPNIIQGLPYSSKCDIWAAGVILYLLLTDEHPFCLGTVHSTAARAKLFSSILQRQIREKPLRECSATDDEIDLIRDMLTKDKEMRLTAAQALEKCRSMQQEGLQDANSDLRILLARAKTFSDHSTSFERAILRIVARHMDDDDLCPLRKAFEQVNTNWNGCIAREELTAAFLRAGLKEDAASEMFRGMDGAAESLEYTEWLIATMSYELISAEQSVLNTFHFLDVDSCGKLSKHHLERALGKEAAAEVCWNANHSVELHEFRNIMRSIAERRALDEVVPGIDSQAFPTMRSKARNSDIVHERPPAAQATLWNSSKVQLGNLPRLLGCSNVLKLPKTRDFLSTKLSDLLENE